MFHIIVADIPGILPGAHKGHSFLRHIERCHSLLYVLDPSNNSLPDEVIPKGSLNLYQQLVLLQNKLKEYDSTLLNKHQMVAVNKMDIDGSEECIRELYNQTNLLLIPISGLHRLNIDSLIDILVYEHMKAKTMI